MDIFLVFGVFVGELRVHVIILSVSVFFLGVLGVIVIVILGFGILIGLFFFREIDAAKVDLEIIDGGDIADFLGERFQVKRALDLALIEVAEGIVVLLVVDDGVLVQLELRGWLLILFLQVIVLLLERGRLILGPLLRGLLESLECVSGGCEIGVRGVGENG